MNSAQSSTPVQIYTPPPPPNYLAHGCLRAFSNVFTNQPASLRFIFAVVVAMQVCNALSFKNIYLMDDVKEKSPSLDKEIANKQR